MRRYHHVFISAPHTHGATTVLPTLLTGAPDSFAIPSEGPRRRRLTGPLVNAGGWLLFGVVWGTGRFLEMEWEAFVAIQVPYILTGYLLSLLLGFIYDRLGVGPSSFARSLAMIVVASYVAGLMWVISAYYYQALGGSSFVHSLLIGAPSTLQYPPAPPGWVITRSIPIFTRQVWSTAPLLFGWSVMRLGLQYNVALREQREQALRATAAARDAQLRMLAYQLNPHFLFNTLNSIRALINEDGQRAREMVTALSGYLRYALVERPLHVALLEEEVASVRGYLSIEKVRFEERLDARLDVDPAVLPCEVPAFLLNPLVENAVKHGAAGTADAPLVLRVEARLVARDRLRLTVENTGGWGNGRNAALASEDDRNGAPGGLGLANVRARLAALHPGDHRIDIEETNGFVRVMVELPARCRNESPS
jgi:signal transduction histidine kinase